MSVTINIPRRAYRHLADDEYSFVVWVCPSDLHLAIRLVERLRRFNPQPVLVIGDTVESFPEFPDLDFVRLEDSPKTLEYGDRYMFDRWGLALSWMQTPWICRLDPDNELIQKVQPVDSEWFGFLYLSTWGLGCSGGSSGYSRHTVEQLMACPNMNYRITYYNGDGIQGMADDTLLIQYLGKDLGIEPEPWPGTIADTVFRRNMLEAGWMMTHPCLDRPLRSHLPKILIDEGSSDSELIARELTSSGFTGMIYTEDRTPYKEAGFGRFLNTPVIHPAFTYKLLRIADSSYHAGLLGPAIGELSENSLCDNWFSAESCLYRKKTTWRALNSTDKDPF